MECDEVYGEDIPSPPDVLLDEVYPEAEGEVYIEGESKLLDWEHEEEVDEDDVEHREHFFVETQIQPQSESSDEDRPISMSPIATSPVPDNSMAPQLIGKETSHAFFCFTQCDAEWVGNVVRKLQSPAYGFKCCNHDRDFEPGMCKSDLILSCVRCCKKVIIVLSEGFLESNWCSTDNAYVLKQVTAETGKVVVVTLNECPVPEFLQNVTPIDALSRSFWQGFIAALRQDISIGDLANNIGHDLYRESLRGKRPEEGLYNGLILSRMISENHICSAQFDSFYCPDEILRKGVSIPQKDYATGIHNLMLEPKLQWYTLCYSKPFSLGMCALLAFLLIIGLVGKASSFGHDSGSIHWAGAMFIAATLCAIIIVLLHVIAYYEKLKLNKNLDFRLAKINANIMRHNVLLGLTDECICFCSRAVLHFIYYNTDQCVGQIQAFLMHQQVAPKSITQDTIRLDIDAADDDTIQLTPSRKQREKEEKKERDGMTVLGNFSPESYQEEAELILLQYSGRYVRKLVTKKLGSPKHHRHMPRGYCLCQYVEKEFFKMDI
ncbi:transmembrane protein 268-like isoform X2 [Ptychodera flava]|uniref:transmembrane protein 268-like isoform X2 n=1 Tax=Ptychodera flava TaxID=63121 RepID=UPI00396A4D37